MCYNVPYCALVLHEVPNRARHSVFMARNPKLDRIHSTGFRWDKKQQLEVSMDPDTDADTA